MQKISLKNGYLKIPKKWIVVNRERARSCNYAAVLECRNSTQLDIPHFVYLFQDSNQYPDRDVLYKLCLERCEKLDKVSKYDCGVFWIEEQGKRVDGKYPYNAMIIRC